MIEKIIKGKLIYLASPYNHPDKAIMDSNFDIVTAKAAELVAQGYVVFSPITYGHTLVQYRQMTTNQEFWMGFCLTFLEKSEELYVYMMPGWDKSKGVAEEIEFAKNNNIKITYI